MFKMHYACIGNEYPIIIIIDNFLFSVNLIQIKIYITSVHIKTKNRKCV